MSFFTLFYSYNSSAFHRIILQDRWRSFNIRKRKQRARSIQPKFWPGKVVHLKRWTSFFEIFGVGPNRSIEFWTEISGNFGWMDRAQHIQKSRTSNFVRRTFYCYAMVSTAGFYCDSRAHNGRKIHSCLSSNKSRWSKMLLKRKLMEKTVWEVFRNRELTTEKQARFWRQFRWFLAIVEQWSWKPWSKGAFISRINSKMFKRGNKVERICFSVDKKTHDRKIRLWSFKRDLLDFPNGIVINYRRKGVNQGGSAPFAREWYGRRR